MAELIPTLLAHGFPWGHSDTFTMISKLV